MLRTLLIATCCYAGCCAGLAAQGAGMGAARLEGKNEAAAMEDKRGVKVDRNFTFTDERGYPFQLKQLFPGERPVVLLLGYYTCPAMCGQVLEATLDALNEVDFTPGEDYQLLNVSIDPKETAEVAKTRKESFLPRFKKVGAADGWRLCVGDKKNTKGLADQVGFNFYWSEHTSQYAHPPAIIFLTKEGVVSRAIVNTVYDAADIRLAIVEAANGELGDFVDQIRLNCLTFDSRTNTYSLTAMTILRIGGAATLIAVASMIIILLRRERRLKQQPAVV